MRLKGIAAVLIGGLLAVSAVATPAAAAPVEPALGNAPLSSAPAKASDIGLFVTDGDRVHYSSTPPAAVSGHGWWIKGTTKATKAKVQIWLEVKNGSSWRVVAHGTKTVYSGGGSANRAAARMVCASGPIGSGTTYTYRSRIDVDLIGYEDSPEQAVTAAIAFKCLPIS